MEFSALIFGCRNVGQRIGMTKKKYFWAFRSNTKGHSLELYSSLLNGKRVVVLDQKIIYQVQKKSGLLKRVFKNKFQFSFILEGFRIRISESDDGFQCFVNGKSFKELADSGEKLLCEQYKNNDLASPLQTKINETGLQDDLNDLQLLQSTVSF